METLKEILDTYSRRARLQPALITILPIGLTALAWHPEEARGFGFLWAFLVSVGGTALLAQMARNRGKQLEPTLYASWGGKPTTRFLRHRDAPNKVLLARRHQKLQAVIPAVSLPNASEEKADPAHADEVYDACVAYLLEKTRERQKFSLLFEENCGYGFRRNLWGLKPIGLLFAFAGTLATGWLAFNFYRTRTAIPLLVVVCGGINFGLLLLWIFWVTPSTVRLAAEAYAERLLAACEDL